MGDWVVSRWLAGSLWAWGGLAKVMAMFACLASVHRALVLFAVSVSLFPLVQTDGCGHSLRALILEAP